MMKTAMQLVLKNKVDQLVKYVAERDKFSKSSSKYHIYDLMVKQVKEDIGFIESNLPIERQQLEDAFNEGAGVDTGNSKFTDFNHHFKTTYNE